MIGVVKVTIQKTVPIKFVWLRIALHVSKVKHEVKQDVPILLWAKPDRSCKVCRRAFYGEQCFANHLIQYETVDKDLEKMKRKLEQDLEEELLSTVEMKSVCDEYQCCQGCLVLYKVNKEVPHKCLHAKCKHCLEYVHIYDHQCFITSEEEKQFKRTLQELRKRKKKKEQLWGMVVEGLPDDLTQTMIDDLIANRQQKLKELDQINSGVPMTEIKAQRYKEKLNDLREKVMLKMIEEEGMELDDITLEMVEERMPQQTEDTRESKKIFAEDLVFADIECILDSTDTFIPILICYTRGYYKTIYHHWGTNCVDLSLETMLRWADEEKSKDDGVKELHIFFHNMKGFDGVFTTRSLYKQNLKVTDHKGTGTKMLHFKHKSLVFKDSLSFLIMPLSNFPNTFGLTKLKKGFFPHMFSKLENLQYEGKIPDLKYYEPQHMNKDKKKESEEWHAEQVVKGESWYF